MEAVRPKEAADEIVRVHRKAADARGGARVSRAFIVRRTRRMTRDEFN